MNALDAAFGATEGAVGDAHTLSFRKLAVFIAKVFQPGLSRRGDKHKHVHLPVGDGIGSASAVIAMAGVEDGAVGELTLHRYGALLGSAEKHQRIYHGTAHLAALPASLHHGFFNLQRTASRVSPLIFICLKPRNSARSTTRGRCP